MVAPGTVLGGRYRLEERIASGGMGDVWRCVDDVLGRTIAVKILLPYLLEEEGFTERFRVQARTMATINHPGVVDIYDYGSDPTAGAYLVMEHIEGDPLSRTLSRVGRLTPARTMALMAQAADALHAAHEKGVVHRNVKPGNLLVRPNGTLVLTDFGIARSTGAAQLTALGSMVAAASYISPEQALGQQATGLSDIYALGVVAYQCLAGRRPFEGENGLEIAMRHVREAPPPLPPDIPPTVRVIVERALAKDPAQRWPNAAAFAAAARRAAAELAGAGSRPGATPVAAPVSSPPREGGHGPVTPTPTPTSPGVGPGGSVETRVQQYPTPAASGYPASPGYGHAQPPPDDPRTADSTMAQGYAAPPRDGPVTSTYGSGGDDDRDRLAFTAAWPRLVDSGRWYPMPFVVYRARQRAYVLDLVGRWEPELGGAPSISHADAAGIVARGTRLTFIPTAPGVVFSPDRAEVVLTKDVHELTFQLRMESAPAAAATITGQIDVYAGPLQIALVPLAFNISESGKSATLSASASTPIGIEARGSLSVASRGVFNEVFASYSHRDSPVVEACSALYRALGVRVLVDRSELLSGADWRSELEALILRSDLFQLYWSSASAASVEVENEWRLALSLVEKGDRFIRPLFWETPMPAAPEALCHLHFGRIELDQLKGLSRELPLVPPSRARNIDVTAGRRLRRLIRTVASGLTGRGRRGGDGKIN